MSIDEAGLARTISSVRRRMIVHGLAGAALREVTGGWVCAHPATAEEKFPSANRNRVMWGEAEGPLSGGQIAAALEAARGLGIGRMFLWAAARAWDEGVHAELERIGARAWPYMTYPALVRPAAVFRPWRESSLVARAVLADEAPAVIDTVRGWYGAMGAASALALVQSGQVEIHAAFDGERPVAIGGLMIEGDSGYLGFAGTEPASRGRGAQTALIASRAAAAAARGAARCICETNSAVPISLSNLKRCGFETAMHWRVYEWGAAPA